MDQYVFDFATKNDIEICQHVVMSLMEGLKEEEAIELTIRFMKKAYKIGASYDYSVIRALAQVYLSEPHLLEE